jgi:hypothetical protein
VAQPDRTDSESRLLTSHERAVVMALLAELFAGRDELVRQLDHVRAKPIDDEGSLALTATDGPPAPVLYRVPVDGSMPDVDGVPICVLLHVDDAGYMKELEIYRADGSKPRRAIKPESLTVIALPAVSGDISAR